MPGKCALKDCRFTPMKRTAAAVSVTPVAPQLRGINRDGHSRSRTGLYAQNQTASDLKMASTLTSSEESQLLQTIEMFEVITQSQPQDYQSLEILKEAYSKLGREEDFIGASKRIAAAYMMQGQLSSAILEYESILQRYPDDAEALAALGEIESRAINLNSPTGEEATAAAATEATTVHEAGAEPPPMTGLDV